MLNLQERARWACILRGFPPAEVTYAVVPSPTAASESYADAPPALYVLDRTT